jgi:transposase-like zinc ribbon protein
VASVPFPKNLIDFQRTFADKQTSAEYLALCRWPDGFRCPRCDGDRAYRLANERRWQCASPACRYQVSVIAGTMLDNTKTPLTTWFWAWCGGCTVRLDRRTAPALCDSGTGHMNAGSRVNDMTRPTAGT